ncbi:MAG: hypothetical protein HYX79_10385 [Chloroflexi bacterium]|nr:hypothetical protein [Chloroflexota bacterium]
MDKKEIRMSRGYENESDLFSAIRGNSGYLGFQRVVLPLKVQRETDAYQILLDNRGNYTRGILERVFNLVDGGEPTPWFGQTLRGNNRKLIFEETATQLNRWIEAILFSSNSIENRFVNALRNKLRGTNTGLPSILLYIQNPMDAKVCLPICLSSIEMLGRSLPEVEMYDPAHYRVYCDTVRTIEQNYGFDPREMDFIFWIVRRYARRVGSLFVFEYDEVERFHWADM